MEPTTKEGARYHPRVIWAPFILALFLGLVVSAGLYFAYLWPSVEPEDADETEPVAKGPAEDRATEITSSEVKAAE